MSILKHLRSALRTVRPPCARCPYRLGIVKFVQNPCPACMTNGYHMYDELTRGPLTLPFIWNAGRRADKVHNRRQ